MLLSPYRANALDWWKWLGGYNSVAISQLRQYIDSCDINKAYEYKDLVGKFFKAFGCDGVDGAFDYITDNDGNIIEKVLVYGNAISKMIEIDICIPAKYKTHKGVYKKSFCRPDTDMSILYSDRLYSYAFIFGPKPKYPNFIYTFDME